MEKFNSQEFRDNLAKDLKTIDDKTERKTVLESEKETTRYKAAKDESLENRQERMSFESKDMGIMTGYDLKEMLSKMSDGWRLPTVEEFYGKLKNNKAFSGKWQGYYWLTSDEDPTKLIKTAPRHDAHDLWGENVGSGLWDKEHVILIKDKVE